MKKFKLILQFLLFIFPWPLRKKILIYLFNFNLDDNCKIGYSIINCSVVSLAKNSRIGHLNYIKGISLLKLDDYSTIGNLNWITGFPKSMKGYFDDHPNRNPSLHIGSHSAITNRHLIDCTDEISIGKFSTIAGFRSQLLTHSIDLIKNRQGCKPIIIGDYAFIGTASILLPGTQIPNYSVLAAGAVLDRDFKDDWTLYAGVPARAVKSIDKNALYFSRQTGKVS